MWLDELRSFVYCIKNSLDDIISGNSDSEKVDQDQVSYHKDILHSSLNDPNITHAKIYIVKVHMTWIFCLNCTVLLESTLQVMKNGGYSFFISHSIQTSYYSFCNLSYDVISCAKSCKKNLKWNISKMIWANAMELCTVVECNHTYILVCLCGCQDNALVSSPLSCINLVLYFQQHNWLFQLFSLHMFFMGTF
jgi:hypothetical protein